MEKLSDDEEAQVMIAIGPGRRIKREVLEKRINALANIVSETRIRVLVKFNDEVVIEFTPPPSAWDMAVILSWIYLQTSTVPGTKISD